MSRTSAGVLSSTMMLRLKSSPTPPSSTLMPRKERHTVEMAVFILPYDLPPKYRLTVTDAPMPPPIATQMKIFVSE